MHVLCIFLFKNHFWPKQFFFLLRLTWLPEVHCILVLFSRFLEHIPGEFNISLWKVFTVDINSLTISALVTLEETLDFSHLCAIGIFSCLFRHKLLTKENDHHRKILSNLCTFLCSKWFFDNSLFLANNQLRSNAVQSRFL